MPPDANRLEALKVAFEKVRIVKMTPTDECRGMSSPLTHGAGLRYSHGPEKVAFAPLGAGDDAVRPKQTVSSVALTRKRPELVVWRKPIDLIGPQPRPHVVANILKVVGPGRYA